MPQQWVQATSIGLLCLQIHDSGLALLRMNARADWQFSSNIGRKVPLVMYIPGEFCVHPRGDMTAIGRRQLRLSYGYEELDMLHRAIDLMKEAAEFASDQVQPAMTLKRRPGSGA